MLQLVYRRRTNCSMMTVAVTTVAGIGVCLQPGADGFEGLFLWDLVTVTVLVCYILTVTYCVYFLLLRVFSHTKNYYHIPFKTVYKIHSIVVYSKSNNSKTSA